MRSLAGPLDGPLPSSSPLPSPSSPLAQPAVGRSRCSDSAVSADFGAPRPRQQLLPVFRLDRGAGLPAANQSRTCSPRGLSWTGGPLPARVWHTPVSIAVAYPPSVTTVYDICPWTCPCPDSHRTVFASAPSWDHREKARFGFGPDLPCRNTHYAAHGILEILDALGRCNSPTHAAEADGLTASHLV